ncbi:1891_t:CDS:1, partial [Gigaspora rosea]
FGEIKAAIKQNARENLKNPVAVIKSKLTKDFQLLLETLLEAQQEILQNDIAFARKHRKLKRDYP